MFCKWESPSYPLNGAIGTAFYLFKQYETGQSSTIKTFSNKQLVKILKSFIKNGFLELIFTLMQLSRVNSPATPFKEGASCFARSRTLQAYVIVAAVKI